jgi:hypothetical protein
MGCSPPKGKFRLFYPKDDALGCMGLFGRQGEDGESYGSSVLLSLPQIESMLKAGKPVAKSRDRTAGHPVRLSRVHRTSLG